MVFEQIRAGGDRNFAYLFGDGEEGAVVDPCEAEPVLAAVAASGLRVRYVIATHGHFDHTGGIDAVVRATGAEVIAHGGARLGPDHAVKGGERFALGGTRFAILHTPGHTPDSVCVLWEGRLMSGDTLFVGKVGGTGFGDDARAEYESLHGVLMRLPDATEVWPGHDYGLRPRSTVGGERVSNPFLLRPDFASFVELKRNWLAYKREHGIP